MTKEFVLDILESCVRHGYLPETFVRNFRIEAEYKDLRAQGMTGKEARERLSETYCTSIKNVEHILYGKKKNEN